MVLSVASSLREPAILGGVEPQRFHARELLAGVALVVSA
jgi:hypothetical protein